ncbi:hypothetical protein CSUI_001995 [Cystoisospora suis]|uniref:Uncharacterized protein n=1 Tax=Cystoisospora suis TaxID=483139 RepID=A0A2C6LB14_9APIC|nr:hypothetical protein CSUI_001995 [Cystoisospora suis]
MKEEERLQRRRTEGALLKRRKEDKTFLLDGLKKEIQVSEDVRCMYTRGNVEDEKTFSSLRHPRHEETSERGVK